MDCTDGATAPTPVSRNFRGIGARINVRCFPRTLTKLVRVFQKCRYDIYGKNAPMGDVN